MNPWSDGCVSGVKKGRSKVAKTRRIEIRKHQKNQSTTEPELEIQVAHNKNVKWRILFRNYVKHNKKQCY